MPLAPEAQRRVAEWISQKCSAFHCTACNAHQWEIGDLAVVMILRDYSSGPVHIRTGETDLKPGAVVPFVCANCGYTVFFSAPKIGLTS